MEKYSNFCLSEWLDYLENRLAKEIQLGLSRLRQVAELMGLMELKPKLITVAGTNGKGSTVAALEAIYRQGGYQVASYTSPHLLRFNERIRINQQAIADEQLCKAFLLIETARGQVPLTYFETITLAALWYFKQHPLDIVILEVGLGGRLDATNLIDSDLAIITTIDFDHQQFLGDTREKIAQEKAGILRAKRPFIFADKNPPHTLLKKAADLGCKTYLYGRDYSYRLTDDALEFIFREEVINLPKLALHGNSIGAAVMASLIMKKCLPLSFSQIKEGINTLHLPGRLQLAKTTHITLFDVSHNPQAVNYLASFIKQYQPQRKVHAIFSALKDKPIAALIAPLINLVDHWYPTLLEGKRAASKMQLKEAFAAYQKVLFCYDDPLSAYQEACRQADQNDLIIVYGSFVTVGKVLSAVYNSNGLARGEISKIDAARSRKQSKRANFTYENNDK